MMDTDRQLTCDEALAFLAAYLDHELAAPDNLTVERHLRHCRSCWSRAEFERRLKERLASLGGETVPTALGERISGLLSEFNAEQESPNTNRRYKLEG